MRSRYSAYVLEKSAYLKATWHPDTLPPAFLLDEHSKTKWLGLIIECYESNDADHAIVEFVARYKVNGRAYRLHEVSRFVREHGRWYYLDGEIG